MVKIEKVLELKKTIKVEIKELTPKDLASLLNLQDKIISNLHEDEQHYILHRTAKDFLKAIESENSKVLGMFDIEKNKIIGQSILSMPNDNEKRELPEYCSEYKNSEVAVLKAVMADPEYRGFGIMKNMLEVREQIAKDNGRKIAITQIAADNPASWVNALRNNMQITLVGNDPEDNAEVVYLKKSLDKDNENNKGNKYSLSLGKDVHKNAKILFNKMVQLSKEGYMGVSWNKKTNVIDWYKNESSNHRVVKNNIEIFSR